MVLTKFKELHKLQLLNYLFIMYAFLLPVSRAGIGISTLLIFFVWLFYGDVKQDIKNILQNKFTLSLLLLIGYTFIALFWSSNLNEGFNYALRYWYYIPLFIIATNLEKKYIKPLISAFLLGMLINELLSYGMYFDLITWTNKASPYATPFMHHIQYSAFVVFTSLFLLNHIFYEESKSMKILYVFFFLTITTNLFINGARTGYVSFALTVFIVLILSMKNKFKAIMLALLISFGSLFSAYSFSDIFQKRIHHTLKEITQINTDKLHTSFGQRIAMFYVGYQIIKEHPLLGVGTGDEMDLLKEAVDTEYKKFKYLEQRRHFHNVFLHITVQLGLIGLALVILVFYYFYRLKVEDKYYSNIKYIFITVFLITCMTGNMFHQQFTIALFSLFVGLIVSQNLLESKRKNQIC